MNEFPSFARCESTELDDLPDFFFYDYLSSEQHAQRFTKKGMRTLASAAIGITGYVLNKMGEQMEKDSKLPKVVTKSMQYAGRAAVLGSKVMTPLFIADTAVAGYEYVQADIAFQRERMDIIHNL